MNIYQEILNRDNEILGIVYQHEVGFWEKIKENMNLYPDSWNDADMGKNYVDQTFEADEDMRGMTKKRLRELVDLAIYHLETEEVNELFKNSQLSEYYDSISEMIEDENNDLQDKMHEIADGNVDIYYHDIYRSLPEVVEYVEQALNEGLIGAEATIDKQIQAGQYVKYLEEINQEYQDIKELFEK